MELFGRSKGNHILAPLRCVYTGKKKQIFVVTAAAGNLKKK